MVWAGYHDHRVWMRHHPRLGQVINAPQATDIVTVHNHLTIRNQLQQFGCQFGSVAKDVYDVVRSYFPCQLVEVVAGPAIAMGVVQSSLQLNRVQHEKIDCRKPKQLACQPPHLHAASRKVVCNQGDLHLVAVLK